MNIKEFFGNWIVRNLLLAVAFVLVLVTAVSLLLNAVTQHGKEIAVPDFTNMTAAEAQAVASSAGLKAVVTDSVYVKRMKPGAVYMQNPKAGSNVKKGRKIRLTANTVSPKEVYMPSLVGVSLRQAKAELLRNGLTLGRLIYVRDIATNNVLRQQRYGFDIAAGAPVSSGTRIDLVLGLGKDDMTYVPDLSGKQYLQAVDILQENSLNVGRLRFEAGIRDYADSVAAVVHSQNPASGTVRKGSEVSLYFKSK
jgi:eukaryotic-like serine/threonine-protein kinase